MDKGRSKKILPLVDREAAISAKRVARPIATAIQTCGAASGVRLKDHSDMEWTFHPMSVSHIHFKVLELNWTTSRTALVVGERFHTYEDALTMQLNGLDSINV